MNETNNTNETTNVNENENTIIPKENNENNTNNINLNQVKKLLEEKETRNKAEDRKLNTTIKKLDTELKNEINSNVGQTGGGIFKKTRGKNKINFNRKKKTKKNKKVIKSKKKILI